MKNAIERWMIPLAGCGIFIFGPTAAGSDLVPPWPAPPPQSEILSLLEAAPQRAEPAARAAGRRGEWNLTLSGVVADNIFSDTGFGADVQLGHFLSDSFEIYISQNAMRLPKGFDHSWFGPSPPAQTLAMTRIGFHQYLARGTLRPYLGLNGGFAYSSDRSGATIHGRLGLRRYSARPHFLDLHADLGYPVIIMLKAGLGWRW